jgi:hypothetical protein
MNENNGIVTKGFFRDTLRDAFCEFAAIINKSFEGIESRMAKQEDLLSLTDRVEKVERHLDEHDQKFDAIFYEIKEIRREIQEVDTRAEVIDLQIRVGKLERKAKL